MSDLYASILVSRTRVFLGSDPPNLPHLGDSHVVIGRVLGLLSLHATGGRAAHFV